MKKPVKPRKPSRPNLQTPTRDVTDQLYLYFVYRHYREDDGSYSKTKGYEFLKDDIIPLDENGDPDGDYVRTEEIKLSILLTLLKDNGIDPEDVIVENEVFYRKCDGQLVMKVSRCLSDEDYEKWVNDNQAQRDKYERDKDRYPNLLEEYKAKKKLWDIHQAELKLKKLKQS